MTGKILAHQMQSSLGITLNHKKGDLAFVPSVINCFMLDAKAPARRLVNAMKKEKVYIGRVWPAWPTHARISVGTKDEMARFKTALLKVMNDLQV